MRGYSNYSSNPNSYDNIGKIFRKYIGNRFFFIPFGARSSLTSGTSSLKGTSSMVLPSQIHLGSRFSRASPGVMRIMGLHPPQYGENLCVGFISIYCTTLQETNTFWNSGLSMAVPLGVKRCHFFQQTRTARPKHMYVQLCMQMYAYMYIYIYIHRHV